MMTLMIALKTAITGQRAEPQNNTAAPKKSCFARLCRQDLEFGPLPLQSVLRKKRAARRIASFSVSA